ncbi:MAG: RnfABCDGE type electron transport complex subunit A [Endomicrobiales bacterium]|nr:RnfABCDGE type electron transport complex subunit A [Endomicrobiales bacterium]
MDLIQLFSVFFAALLINNIILMRFLGLCAFFGVSEKMGSSIGMSLAVAFVMTLATAATWPLYHYVLEPLNLTFLRTISFILVIASLVQLVELFMKKNIPGLYRALGIYLPLITTNCAIFGLSLLNINYNYGFLESIFHALGVASGFGLSIILFTGLRMRLNLAPIPKFIAGYPLVFFTAALMSLAFMGFSGMFGIH